MSTPQADAYQGYDIAVIWRLMEAAFRPKDLKRFCMERHLFYPILNSFGVELKLDDMVDEVLDYCRIQMLLPELVDGIKEVNPRQFARYQATLRKEVEVPASSEALDEAQLKERARKQQVLTELLGPVVMNLTRTKRAFDRWWKQNLFLEAEIIRKGNLAVRNLLIDKANLVPPDLMGDANDLIEHYDVWLEEYERLRGGDEPDLNEPFVFVGVGEKSTPFPTKAEQHFRARFEALTEELYGKEGE